MEAYYVVKKGTVPGIYKTWLECKKMVDGFKGAVFKKFNTLVDAQNFLNNDTHDISKHNIVSGGIPIASDEMNKIHQMSKNIKNAEYSDKLNYNVQNWNSIENNIYIFTDGSSRLNNKKKYNTAPTTTLTTYSELSLATRDINTNTNTNTNTNDKTYFNSGIGVYIGYQCINIKEQYNNKTNNQCELIAMDYAFKLIVKYYRELSEIGKIINIVSDSEYCIKACSIWLSQWKKNNWITSTGENVKNKELIESIDASMTQIKIINSNLDDTKKIKVKLIHVNSHQEPDTTDKLKFSMWFGNYIADALATNKI